VGTEVVVARKKVFCLQKILSILYNMMAATVWRKRATGKHGRQQNIQKDMTKPDGMKSSKNGSKQEIQSFCHDTKFDVDSRQHLKMGLRQFELRLHPFRRYNFIHSSSCSRPEIRRLAPTMDTLLTSS
jgi:hypothetical protein